ncbi:MAG: dihydrodipicolinate synthase family protein [Chloroflexi bacterium]|nr:dihydrodipicolinate synthase family protein [Chloroflexota bacterium]
MAEIRGVIAAMVTPFTARGARVDWDWIPAHIDYLRRRGIDGVLVTGTNGEFASLTVAERKRIAEVVAGAAEGIPFWVGTGSPALPEAIELTRHALEKGAAAVLVIPPYYFKGVPREGLVAYYRTLLAEAVPAGRGILLYNIPHYSGVALEPELIEALLKRQAGGVLGLKDSSKDVEHIRAYVERFPDLAIYVGSDEHAQEALRAGAMGIVSAVANVFPTLVGEVYQAFRKRDDSAGPQRRLSQVRALLDKYPSIAALKYMLHVMGGLPETHTRPPWRDLSDQEKDLLWQDLEHLGLL